MSVDPIARGMAGRAAPASGAQAADTFLPVIVRTPAGRAAGAVFGIKFGNTTFNSVTDPEVALGYFAPTGEVSSSFQIEGDWRVSSTNITEMYWQIVKTDGSSRRPFYGKYNRADQRSVAWYFMIGNGTSDTGSTDASFQINWDDDTSAVGVNCFKVTPNRLSLYGVATGGITADETRLRLYSSTGKGSAIALTYNGSDAEGTANPTWVMYTTSTTQMNAYMHNTFWGGFLQPSATQSGLSMVAGIQLGDGALNRQSWWASTGIPSNTMGVNNDWCISDNGHIYFKSAGAWAQKI
jgi:hypothetical protein